jgi:dTDP-4-amino-4,6-dideoxygalactose transaminase
VNRSVEQEFVETFFGNVGHCATVCNATIGLVLAVRMMMDEHWGTARRRRTPRYALMPSFTFAAAAQAALWNGLTPLLCDIEPDTWLPSLCAQEELLDRFRGEVAVVVPYATFGNNLDLTAYADLSARHAVPVVVDAAASLGSCEDEGRQFGACSAFPIVYSMHVTKTFSAGEAGLVYSADAKQIDRLRCMTNFGFGEPRCATMPGLNGKLSEVGALLCREKLRELDALVTHREDLALVYREQLPGLRFQAMRGVRHAYQFMPALLPPHVQSATVVDRLADAGVMVRTYFSPHLAEQPFFRANSVHFDLRVTEDVASRIISLPLYDGMTRRDVTAICARVHGVLAEWPTRLEVAAG